MFVVLWEYEVRAEALAAFEALYGPEGDWVVLFREHAGYVDTALLRDGLRYLTIDRWTSDTAYEAFLTAAKSRYAQIDAQGDSLTVAERCLGRFHTT
jgi:heme-degrading monooxygenase HmoA